MSVFGRCPPARLRRVLAGAFAITLCACGSSDDDSSPPPLIAVLSAFPGELAAVLEYATVDETVMVDGRVFRKGTLNGVPVVLAMTRIGLLNAAATTQAVFEQFPVTGVVVSGVAGSPLQIGDVTVPETWQLMDGATYAADAKWLALARRIAKPGAVTLDRCTQVTTPPVEEPVCMPRECIIAVGGLGQSADPFGEIPFPCQPTGDVFGCDVSSAAARFRNDRGGTEAQATVATVETEEPIAVDEETAAIAREAAARGVPFIAFRAVSDGAGDPLGLRGFPAQFFAYYPLASRNAAAAAAAFLAQLDRN